MSSSHTYIDTSVNIWRHGKVQVNTYDFRREVQVICQSEISAFHRVDTAYRVFWIVTLSTRNTVPDVSKGHTLFFFKIQGGPQGYRSNPTFLKMKPVRSFERSEINNPDLPRSNPEYPKQGVLNFQNINADRQTKQLCVSVQALALYSGGASSNLGRNPLSLQIFLFLRPTGKF